MNSDLCRKLNAKFYFDLGISFQNDFCQAQFLKSFQILKYQR